jgi:hypothetical protein
MQICTADVQCTDGYVHYLKCTDIVELCTYTDVFFFFFIIFAGWPVGSDWLLQGVRCYRQSSADSPGSRRHWPAGGINVLFTACEETSVFWNEQPPVFGGLSSGRAVGSPRHL